MNVDLDTLRVLLTRSVESQDLDYKGTWDVNDKGEVVEITKDIAAMESLGSGGYIVIGADDFGTPSGTYAVQNTKDYDEQRVRSKIVAHLGEPLDISVALHSLDGDDFLILGVGPNREGLRIMPKVGQYGDTIVWREGDVYVRRGTSSMRWNQHDARGIIERVIAVRKEEWRFDILETVKLATPAFGPGGYVDVNVEMPLTAFSGAVTESIRRSDLVGLDLLIRKTVRDASQISIAVDGDGAARALELSDQLVRLDVLAALVARYGMAQSFDRCLQSYQEIYGRIEESDLDQSGAFPQGHEQMLAHLYALGAFLVREQLWASAARVARLEPTQTSSGFWQTLLRKAEVKTARAGVGIDVNGTRIGLIERSKGLSSRLFELIDSDITLDESTNLLAQFDVYRGISLLTGSSDEEPLKAYPNFAFYYSKRSEPAFLNILETPSVRAAFFSGSDDQLRVAFRRMSKVAITESFAFQGWDGFTDYRLLKFTE